MEIDLWLGGSKQEFISGCVDYYRSFHRKLFAYCAGVSPDGDWEWGGCADNVQHGYKKSREFMDAKYRKRSDLKTQVMLHNNEAGRLVKLFIFTCSSMKKKKHVSLSFYYLFFSCWKLVRGNELWTKTKTTFILFVGKKRRSRTLCGLNASVTDCPVRAHCAPVGVNCLCFVTWPPGSKRSLTELPK